MSARTCQLCGKPLSRLWAGGGDDFCSREHRNQFRLRRGMDRLQEANKVASLLRRRENPKPISTGLLMSALTITPRAFGRAPIVARPRALSLFTAATRIRSTARIAPVKDRCLPPPPRGLASRGAARAILIAARFYPRSSSLAVPRHPVRIGAAIPQARAAPLRYALQAAAANRRQFGIARGGVPRLHLAKGAIRLKGPGANHASYNGSMHRPRIVPVAGRAGKALRVSSSAGFRLPAQRNHLRAKDGREPAGMAWPERPIPFVAGKLPPGRALSAAGYRGLDIIRSDVAWNHLCTPRKGPAGTQFEWPGAIGCAASSAQPGTPPAPRQGEANWNCGEAIDALDRRTSLATPSGFSEPRQIHMFVSRPRAVSGSAESQGAIVPFVPQDSTLMRTPFVLHGTVAGSMGGSPAKTAAGGPVKFEENFAAGWSDWAGGVDQWKLDVAGVRTGPLALYTPSLPLRDYELEFLTRIENRSVTWVFRAGNFDEYYMATVSVSAAGNWEFTRRVMTADGEQSAHTVPVPKGPGAKKSFSVRTRVEGSEFSVAVDGEIVDRWMDGRFPAGGIGFIGALDDRARLYWVRLSTAGTSGKEHRT